MRSKFTTLTIAAAMAAGLAAAPASAQYGYPGDRGLMQRFNAQIGQTEQRIERLAERRAISGSEYNALRNHARELRNRLHRFARNGLDRGEVQDISDRIDNLRDRIRDERRDGHRNGW